MVKLDEQSDINTHQNSSHVFPNRTKWEVLTLPNNYLGLNRNLVMLSRNNKLIIILRIIIRSVVIIKTLTNQST